MIDCHIHAIPEGMLEWLRANAERAQARFEQRDAAKAPFLVVGGRWPFELKPVFHDRELFLHHLDAAGVERVLLSPIPQLFFYEADPALACEAARAYNEALLAWRDAHPDRIELLATVPLGTPETAEQELRWAMDRGMRGAIVGPGVGEKLLSDPAFEPFWQAANERQAIVFLHPLLSRDPRLARPQLPNLAGVPWETTVAAIDLIFAGVLDRYPRVRILLAHGGGYLPYQIGRLDKGYEVWEVIRRQLAVPPSEYLRRFWYDTVLWRQETLAYLRAIVGPDHIVPGSDFPFDLSVWPPAAAPEGEHTLFSV
ncbi:amidohydrolase family protein [Thermomicrobium sp. 4228-Ro]|uniref:amidohydrolase family protein n=1 Tax=Thermomicrobium sp. 4228-Ro TaxID=2993937 RepID=UPI002248C287|nr:amidohydrolase family protein [Thermomicrobium sp. 4228-Ro]MCX2726626.1 amidohydrolase family protein [Thermomicrobium sp. 4228-Ro]